MKINGTDLVAWADHGECRTLLPELVRRLIHGTTAPSDLQEIDFPAGEGVQKPGVDGYLRVSRGNGFVPEGVSVWEISTEKATSAKANRDLGKRQTRPDTSVDPTKTTFVMVTPRRWNRRKAWAAAKRKEGHWADVRVLDADLLEQWLDEAPAARAWLGPHVRKPQEAQELEAWWSEWSRHTKPETSKALTRGGRDEETQKIFEWLAAPASVLSVEVDDDTEAAAFLYASMCLRPRAQAASVFDRAVVARAETVKRLTLGGHGLVIVAGDCPIEVARRAADHGHHILRATRSVGREPGISLKSMPTTYMSAALERMGLRRDEAVAFAYQSGGSLCQVRRGLGESEHSDPALIPWLLVPTFDENDDEDLSTVAAIVDKTPAQVRDDVRRWSMGPKAVLTRLLSEVRWTSHEAAWRALADHLLVSDCRRFADVVLRVFDVSRRSRAHVGLRAGLIEVLAKAAIWFGERPAGPDAQGMATWVVTRLMEGLDSKQAWAGLSPAFAGLVEAAPAAWLRAAERHIVNSPDDFREFMAASAGLGWTVLSDLVRALEILSWSPDYLSDAALVLARLAELDPGGNSHPRPADALRAIFMPAFPQTCASLEVRFGAMERLARACPEVSLRLVLGFFGSRTVHYCARPELRTWDAGWVAGAPAQESGDASDWVQGFAIRVVAREPDLWPLLIREARWFSEARYSELLVRLEQLEPGAVDDASRAALSAAIREALSAARSEQDDDEVPGTGHVRRLARLLDSMAPRDLRDRHRWLFERIVTLPDVDDVEAPERHNATLDARRDVAARELVAALSNAELMAYVETLAAPAVFGASVAATASHRARVIQLLWWTFVSSGDPAREFRDGMVRVLFNADPPGVLEATRDPSVRFFGVLTDVQRAELLAPLWGTRALWKVVDGMSPNAKACYWRRMDPSVAALEHTALVVERLVEHGRTRKAVEVAGLRNGWASIPPALIVQLLEAMARSEGTDEPVMRGMKSHHLRILLERLRAAGEEWRDHVVRIERALWRLIDGEYRPRFVFEELERHPETFVELVCEVEPTDDGQRGAVSEAALVGARRARDILSRWDTLPGESFGPAGTVFDGDVLLNWIRKVREGLRKRNRRRRGDEHVGAVLGRAPQGADGHWPHEAVRAVIECLDDIDSIATGFQRARRDVRGWVTLRPGMGGADTRKLVERYEVWAAELRRRWPTTARLLDGLAHKCREQAAREDRDPMYASPPRWPLATPQDCVRVFCEELQARGQITFSFENLVSGRTMRPTDARRAVEAMEAERLLATLQRDFFVVVPLDFRSVGAPPSSWFLDAWMAFAQAPYAVALTSTDATSGGAKTTLFVLVTKAVETVTVANVRFVFVVDPKAGADFGVSVERTPTGSMRVTSAERRLLDLVEHADAFGGLDSVAPFIDALIRTSGSASEAERRATVVAYASCYSVEVVVRLRQLLTSLGHRSWARYLAAVARNRPDVPNSPG